jgi:hypothetical protein
MRKKARSDCRISKLPAPLRAELARMLSEENPSYDEAAAWLSEKTGRKFGRTIVRNWFVLHSWKENAEQARATAAQVEEKAAASDNYDKAILALIREKAYILARDPNADVGDLATLASVIGDSVKLRLKEREVSVSERRVAVLEEKERKADAAENLAKDKTLSDAERTQRLKGIFGM